MEQGLQKNKDLFIFTIQNVPIKLKKLEKLVTYSVNLQYKMFLLNFFQFLFKIFQYLIYNTKCSY